MGRDLFTETIAATDKGEVNETGASMSYPPIYSTGSCPEKAGNITINKAVFSLNGEEAMIMIHDEPDFTGTELTLSFTPVAGYAPKVFVNGLLNSLTTHYTILGAVITFVNALTNDNVQVQYARA